MLPQVASGRRASINDAGGYIDVGKAPPDLLAALLRSVGASQPQAEAPPADEQNAGIPEDGSLLLFVSRREM